MSQPPSTTPAPWVCPGCGRAFRRTGQRHSCRRVEVDTHVGPDHPMRPLFDRLVGRVRGEVTPCELIALPCCLHLGHGADDFLAVLPRQHHLEVRFTLDHELADPRIHRSTRTATRRYKHSVLVRDASDLDATLLGWIREAWLLAEQPQPV